tara:strand:- start:263 stop:460 length:198 start_codon:yes stop_codon:yes gene_type:complete
MTVGDIVRPSRSSVGQFAIDSDDYNYGIVLDVYEDDYGIYYYEVHWTKETSWWKKNELEMISENS